MIVHKCFNPKSVNISLYLEISLGIKPESIHISLGLEISRGINSESIHISLSLEISRGINLLMYPLVDRRG